jgi:hypothetical protein
MAQPPAVKPTHADSLPFRHCRGYFQQRSGRASGPEPDSELDNSIRPSTVNQRWSPFGASALMEGKAIATEARTADLEKQLKA